MVPQFIARLILFLPHYWSSCYFLSGIY